MEGRRLRRYLVVRRVRDVILSGLGLMLLWPVMVVLGVIIVLDDPGAGPIFSQTRIWPPGAAFYFL